MTTTDAIAELQIVAEFLDFVRVSKINDDLSDAAFSWLFTELSQKMFKAMSVLEEAR